MASSTAAPPRVPAARDLPALVLRGGVVTYLSLLVVLPLAAIAVRGAGGGPAAFWHAISDPQAVAALRLTVLVSLGVTAINVVMGTLVALVLVRDRFPGRRLVDALIDLPFALPTIVTGLVLLSLYGPTGPLGIDVAYSRAGIALALLFITLPFVARSVQPVLEEVERDVEEAARTLGAGTGTVYRRIVLPTLVPAILGGASLAFARALGEFGSIVLLAGNVPFKTEMGSVYVFGLIESDDARGAAAVSLVLLALALAVQVAFSALRRRSLRHVA